LKRECLEELAVNVIVHDLRFVRDYIRANHPCHGPDWHQVELMFLCDLEDGAECKAGTAPDTYQEGIEWIPIDRLEEYRLFPKALRKVIPRMQDAEAPVYLGDGD
jgi:8-oxo-dGTP pyrophosphatase MutT (NUDIX family)